MTRPQRSSLPADPFVAAVRLLRAQQWTAGLAAFDEAGEHGVAPDAGARLMRLIGRIRLTHDPAALAELDAELITAADGRADLRRYIVGPLVREDRLAPARHVLEQLVQAYPASADDWQLLVSLMARSRDWSAAIDAADRAAASSPSAIALQALRIQVRLQAGEVETAAGLARELDGRHGLDPSLAQLAITALLRHGDDAAAARIAGELDGAKLQNPRTAATVVRALVAARRTREAITIGEAALQSGTDGADLRLQLARACLATGPDKDRQSDAMRHLNAGLLHHPDEPRLNGLRGDLLSRAGRFGEAVPLLAEAAARQPQLERPRALYARALKQVGRHGEAADQLLHLLRAAPDRDRWQRSAAAALIQSGRVDDADTLFDAYVERRRRALPANFEEGLDRLWDRVDHIALPAARLDWAWSLRGESQDADRRSWERAARWGHLADHFMLDWLECRDDRAEEVMALLADLDAVETFIADAAAPGQGIIFATAHVGLLYAAPMVLELLGRPFRWLASTPGVARTGYAETLISTSDQTEAQIARRTLRALEQGCAIAIAADGALNPAAPRVGFAGQSVTYSSFAARAAYRTGALSVFGVAHWQAGEIALALERLPSPAPGEGVNAYVARWQNAYFRHLRVTLGGAPENLRLSGGIWRHVA